PEFEARPFDAISANVTVLHANAVDGTDVNAVSDGMRTLNRLPRAGLRLPVLFLFGRMPSDRGGIEEEVRTLQRGQARALRVPLIPTDQSANPADGGAEKL